LKIISGPHRELTVGQQKFLHLHAAQLFALGNEKDRAVEHLDRAVSHEKTRELGPNWNDMLAATRAFLMHDRKSLVATKERLAEIGKWMKVNGESIYGTTASPFKELSWGRCTTKLSGDEATLYLHVFDWPADGKLVVPGLKNTVQSASLLATHNKLKTSASLEGVIVSLPTAAPDKISSTIVLKIKGAPQIN